MEACSRLVIGINGLGVGGGDLEDTDGLVKNLAGALAHDGQ